MLPAQCKGLWICIRNTLNLFWTMGKLIVKKDQIMSVSCCLYCFKTPNKNRLCVWKKNHCVTFKEDICTSTYILFSWRNLQLTLEVSISLALRNSFVSKDQSSITMQKHPLNELRFFVGPKFVFLLNLYICCLWRHCRKSPSQNNWFTSGEIWSDNNNKPLPSLVIFFNFFFGSTVSYII